MSSVTTEQRTASAGLTIQEMSQQCGLCSRGEPLLEREMELMRIRLSYLDGKIAFWQAVEAGEAERVERIAKENRRFGALMK